MSISNNREIRKAVFALSSSVDSASIIITLTLLAGGFVLFSPTPMIVTTALAQEEDSNTNTTAEAAATTTTTNTDTTAIMSNLNFSEFSELNNSAQSDEFTSLFSSFMTDVNGTYANPDIGFQMDLPTGWKGKEISFLINTVFAAPREINLELEGGDFQEPAAFMTILGIDEGTFDMIEGFSESSALEEGGVGEEETLLQGSDPLDTTTPTFGNTDVLSCTFFQPSFVTINGINAEERLGECIAEEGGTNPKTKSYTFATQNDSLIVVGFYSNSTSSYDQNLPLFEESVKTINISRPADIAASEIYNRYKELVESQLSNQTGM
jgi:hypothetical protein